MSGAISNDLRSAAPSLLLTYDYSNLVTDDFLFKRDQCLHLQDLHLSLSLNFPPSQLIRTNRKQEQALKAKPGRSVPNKFVWTDEEYRNGT